MDDFTPAIRADGGDWAEAEVLGQHAIVKVRAGAATLTAIGAAAGFDRIPLAALDDPLSSLSAGQRAALRARVEALGYSAAEIAAALPGDLGSYTLRQLLRFVASRRRKVRYDAATDSIVDDGPVQPVRMVDHLDGVVR